MFPIHLVDYFKPISPSIFLLFLVFFFTFEMIGFWFSQKIVHAPSWTRSIWWAFGLGVFICAWFLVNLFVPITQRSVLLVLFTLVIPSFFFYLKHRGWQSLFRTYWLARLAIISFVPLIPLVLIKASLPPYLTDEMAYQYMSPVDLSLATKWSFSGGIYHVIPKSLNLLYHLTFALTKTYALARLFHFLILFTAMLSLFSWLRDRINLVAAFIFWILFFFAPQLILYESATSGYIDIGAASFIFLATITTYEWLIDPNKSTPVPALAFWALALGTKYTAITSFSAQAILVSLYFIFHKTKINLKLNKKLAFNSVIIFLLFGGFWYLKNLVITGNPIYPFLFGCRPLDCVGDQALFSGWTTPVTIRNLPTIFNDILFGWRKLELAFIGALFFSLLHIRHSLKKIDVFLILALMMELFFIKAFAGFYFRYFWHLQFFCYLIIVSHVPKKVVFKPLAILKLAFCLYLVVLASINFIRTTKFAYAQDRLPKIQVDYALQKIDISDWVRIKFPKMHHIALWCDQLEVIQPIKLYRSDPDLIWSSYEGQVRAFMTNCIFSDTGFDPKKDPSTATEQLRSNLRSTDYYISLAKCQKPEEVQPLSHETKWQEFLRQVDNNVVCSIPQLLPHLYRVGE